MEKPVILVHGAFSDGSVWNKVILKLESKRSWYIISNQDPMLSKPDDVANVILIATFK